MTIPWDERDVPLPNRSLKMYVLCLFLSRVANVRKTTDDLCLPYVFGEWPLPHEDRLTVDLGGSVHDPSMGRSCTDDAGRCPRQHRDKQAQRSCLQCYETVSRNCRYSLWWIYPTETLWLSYNHCISVSRGVKCWLHPQNTSDVSWTVRVMPILTIWLS